MTPIHPLIRDIQAMLPRANWDIGTRTGAPRYTTLHYNGPAVRLRGSQKAELNQLKIDARYHMRPGALGSAKGGDGLQYHFAVLSDGTIYQTRALDSILWHCGHKTGNSWSLSVQLPLGGNQDATDSQWAATTLLFDWLRREFAIPTDRILGHCEWGTKPDCPGPSLLPRLVRWRKAAASTPLHRGFAIARATAIYEGPSPRYPVALRGQATLAPAAAVEVDAIVIGTFEAGDSRWLHLKNGVGFIPLGATAGL